jgi:hypothetical protein
MAGQGGAVKEAEMMKVRTRIARNMRRKETGNMPNKQQHKIRFTFFKTKKLN